MDDATTIETFEVIPRCSKCGSDDLRMPEGITSQDDLTDDSPLTCANCGTVTTYAALVESCETSKANDLINESGTTE